MKTGTLSSFGWGRSKGRHTTTERHLFALPIQPNGSDPPRAVFIDNPGIRELGLLELAGSGENPVEREAERCRFADCSHSGEPHCTVRRAIAEGRLSKEALHNYRKLRQETQHYQASAQEQHRKSREQGKLYRSIQNGKRRRQGQNKRDL